MNLSLGVLQLAALAVAVFAFILAVNSGNQHIYNNAQTWLAASIIIFAINVSKKNNAN